MGFSYMASDMYGGSASPQPVSVAASGPTHTPGTPEPVARTIDTTGAIGNPTILLVGILGLAILLIHLSVHFSVGVSK